VTIVFSDVSGSTRLGEELDAEALRRVMERYFEEMRSILERHGGTVETFIGDAVMAASASQLRTRTTLVAPSERPRTAGTSWAVLQASRDVAFARRSGGETRWPAGTWAMQCPAATMSSTDKEASPRRTPFATYARHSELIKVHSGGGRTRMSLAPEGGLDAEVEERYRAFEHPAAATVARSTGPRSTI
jgi:class 3 adenylate cyclase